MVICVQLTVPPESSPELTAFNAEHYPDAPDENVRLTFTITDTCVIKVTKDGANWIEINGPSAGNWSYPCTLTDGTYNICASVM
jgi:hypothetical protein